MKYGHFNKFGWGVGWKDYDEIPYIDLCYISHCMNAEAKYLEMEHNKQTFRTREFGV